MIRHRFAQDVLEFPTMEAVDRCPKLCPVLLTIGEPGQEMIIVPPASLFSDGLNGHGIDLPA
jgi:hypothetical protein